MDPKATLIRLDQAISDCDIAEAYAALDDYWSWRAKYGYEPLVYEVKGDEFMRQCVRRLHDLEITNGGWHVES